jgi:hypothetical protein
MGSTIRLAVTAAILGIASLPLVSAAPGAAGASPRGDTTRVVVTNDDGTFSLLKPANGKAGRLYEEFQNRDMVLRNLNPDGTFRSSQGPHWPANQYVGDPNWWWLGLTTGQVAGFKSKHSLAPLANPAHTRIVETYRLPGVPAGAPTAGSNFVGVTPSGKSVWNSAREIDEIQEIDADPASRTFGQVVTRLKVPDNDPSTGPTATLGAARPCDASVTPDGRYLYEPDLGGESVTVVDLVARTIVRQIDLKPHRADPSIPIRPFMLTTDGRYAIVETLEAVPAQGIAGSYVIIDVRDPGNPVVAKKLVQAGNLGFNPQTSEFTADGRYAFLITNGRGSPANPATFVNGTVDVLDLATLTISNKITLPQDCRPHAGDFSEDGRHFFVNCSGLNSVAVIDVAGQAVAQEVPLSVATIAPFAQTGNRVPRGIIVR